jgi:dipeptide/tripeptide permease
LKQHTLDSKILPVFLYLSGSKFLERFSYYAMRAILVLYLTDTSQGLGWDNVSALELYGMFAMLVVALQLVGGILSDFVLGTRRTLLLGALAVLSGYLLLVFGNNSNVYLSIGLIAFGSGCYIPSHWGILGQIFNEHKYKLDGAIILTHIFINVGAMLSGILVGLVVASYSWKGGFALASLTQLICFACIMITSKKLPVSSLSKSRNSEVTSDSSFNMSWVIIVAVISLVMALSGDLSLSAFSNSNSLLLQMGSFITTMVALIAFGIWWWFKPSSSVPKLAVGGGLFLLAFVVGDSLVETNHDLFFLFATGYLITVGLVEALLSPILMSILLQRSHPKYIATTAAMLLIIPSVVGLVVNALA